jgi:hypothetical protein
MAKRQKTIKETKTYHTIHMNDSYVITELLNLLWKQIPSRDSIRELLDKKCTLVEYSSSIKTMIGHNVISDHLMLIHERIHSVDVTKMTLNNGVVDMYVDYMVDEKQQTNEHIIYEIETAPCKIFRNHHKITYIYVRLDADREILSDAETIIAEDAVCDTPLTSDAPSDVKLSDTEITSIRRSFDQPHLELDHKPASHLVDLFLSNLD